MVIDLYFQGMLLRLLYCLEKIWSLNEILCIFWSHWFVSTYYVSYSILWYLDLHVCGKVTRWKFFLTLYRQYYLWLKLRLQVCNLKYNMSDIKNLKLHHRVPENRVFVVLGFQSFSTQVPVGELQFEKSSNVAKI